MNRTENLIRRLSILVAAILGLSGLTIVVAVAAGPSSAQGAVSDPACGDTITGDTTLHADLVDCPSNGLVIGADDLTLDLNGHTIEGDAVLQDPCPDDTSCDWGVDNGAGHSGVKVVNGTVTGFDFGVVVGGADRNVLSRLTVTDNNSSGIVVFGSAGVRIGRSTIARNGLDTDFSGLGIFNTTGGVLAHNVVEHNGDIGLYAEGMDDHRIIGNTFAGNPEAGLLFDGSRNVLTGNVVDDNGDGIAFGGDDNVVSGNRITRALGCPDGCGYGISFEGGSGNVFAWNTVFRALVGIRVDGFTGLATHTVVRQNIVRRSAKDNIAINHEHAGPVRRTRVIGNIVTRAGDDGIDVNSASTTISGNLALRNHDLGIEAVAGVTGRGNKAAGNGDPRQCTHVAC
jgi:parallel beta-helix repeat protein